MTGFDVYAHTSPTGKRYVGWTGLGVARRWSWHVRDALGGSDTPFHRAIRKHGAAAFTHEIIERVTTEAGAKRAEQLWIARLGTFGVGGYNATIGGDGTKARTYRHTPETREKIAAAHRGRKRSAAVGVAISAAVRGKKRGAQRPEWIAKRVAAYQATCAARKGSA